MQSFVLLCVLVGGSAAAPQTVASCGVDDEGRARLPGDTWRDDCNRCRCLSSGIPGCTKKLCGSFPVISKMILFLLFPGIDFRPFFKSILVELKTA